MLTSLARSLPSAISSRPIYQPAIMRPSSSPPALGPAPLPSDLPALMTHLATAKHSSSSLVSLYELTHSTLPTTILARSPPHLIHSDLVTIMDCKLTFGQNRPALRSMIAKLDPATVKSSSTAALAALVSPGSSSRDRVEKAMAALLPLKGVGPATASLVLSLVSDEVPFFSDEAAVEVLKPTGGRKGLKYSIKEYWDFWEGVGRRVAKEGAEKEGGRRGWERKCWAGCVRGGEDEGGKADGGKADKKRARVEQEEVEEDKNEVEGDEPGRGTRSKRSRAARGT